MVTQFKVFFSHKTSDNKQVHELQNSFKELLPNFPIEDVSKKLPSIESWKYIASDIIQSCDLLVSIVSENTHSSNPVDWEIREAFRLNKPIIVTTLSKEFQLPSACQDLNLKAIPWDPIEIAGQIGEMLLPRAIFLMRDHSIGSPQPSEIFQQYNLMVQSWESLISRRQTVNVFYVTANTALFTGIGLILSFLDKNSLKWAIIGVAIIAFLGTFLSWNWYRTIRSYGTLSRAKSKVVIALETYMPVQLFDAEWKVLETKRYISTTAMDQQTASFFISLFSIIGLISVGLLIWQLYIELIL